MQNIPQEPISGPVLGIPDFCIVALVGASGCGKSTFAARHFLPTEILSSDAFRAWVSDDETSLEATDDAFETLYHLARVRLRRRRLCVVDATNVQQHARKEILKLAEEFDTLAVAVVLNVPERVCHERNQSRPNRDFGPHVVRNQTRSLRDTLRSIRREGFRHVYVLETQEQIDHCRFERRPLWTDRRGEHGPFDIIGDIHGCYAELTELLTALGYRPEGDTWSHPEGRRAIFLGDLVDRGPGVVESVRLVMGMVAAGSALCVPGNHDVKLMRALNGRNVKVAHGLQESLDQIEALPEGERETFKKEYVAFADSLVSHYWLEDGKLVVAHAGMKEAYQGRASRRVRDFALYGDTTGETDEFGLPIRYPWAEDYRGSATVVYGHTPVPEAEWLNRTINLDTGCVFGGKLSALRWPEREIVQVAAKEQYATPARPFLANDGGRVTDDGSSVTSDRGARDDVWPEVTELVEQLRSMVAREEKIIDNLGAKLEIERQVGNEELARMIERELGQRRQTLEQVRANYEAAQAAEGSLGEAMALRPGRMAADPETLEGHAQDRVEKAEQLLPRLSALAREAAASVVKRLGFSFTPQVETPDEILDSSVRRMKEAQIQNRENAVQAITQKNQFAMLVARQRRAVKELETQVAAAEAEADAKQAVKLRKSLVANTEALAKLETMADEAARHAEEVKAAIRREDEAIRVAVAEALRAKAVSKSGELLARGDALVLETQAGQPAATGAVDTQRPDDPATQRPSLQWQHDEVLRAEDVLGKRFVPTTLMGNVTVRAENAAAALEVMSRFAVEPRWLVYLPPTMSPSETTEEPGYLEYPREAFDYYRKNGVERVVCQTKHMGSRAVLVVCRDEEAARRRFGAREGVGACYTRTGRQFFDDALHAAFMREVSEACGRAGLWEELQTDWLCLDAELMPWNAKAQGLLREQYAPVGAAARLSLNAAVEAARQAAGRGLPLGDLVTRLEQRRADAEHYVEAYGRYCWETEGLRDLKLAPFHLLATEGRTYFDRDHEWHVATLGRLAEASGLFRKTDSRTVDLSDETSCEAAVQWWLEYTGAGGEGMVVKPLQFLARGPKGPVQPAVKVRGRDYLRIIYGPEYTEPENLERLRKRGLHSKRALAIREFALGVEAMERFVRREPLRLVHECVFAVLALESEPVDPRL